MGFGRKLFIKSLNDADHTDADDEIFSELNNAIPGFVDSVMGAKKRREEEEQSQ